MASNYKAPENETLPWQKLRQLIKRYDVNELLDAATTFQEWNVISNDERKEIERHSSKQERLDRLISLIAENGRISRFANFILRYNSPIQDAALALLQPPVSMTKPKPAVDSQGQVHNDCKRPEKTYALQQHACHAADQSSRKSSDTNLTSRGSPMDVDATACTGSSESCSAMDTGSKDNLFSQDDNLSSSSQESPDFGYCSGLSKDFQSQNQSTAASGGSTSFQSPQKNLEVIQKNLRSRQRKLKHGDNATKQQHNHYSNFHPGAVQSMTVNLIENHYYPKEQRMMPQLQWPPQLAKHIRDIIQNLNMEMLAPHLTEKGLLTTSDYQDLLGLASSRKQSEHFVVNVLPTKGGDGFEHFLECLKDEEEHSGHQYLFQLLEKSKVNK